MRTLQAVIAILALAAGLAFAPAEPAFDIAVSGLNVLATQNHTPVSSSLASGQPGQEYYLLCGFTPTGSGGPSAVQFRFLVNGLVVRDIQAPVQSGQYVAMGEFWTPPSAGTYTLRCEANPHKTFTETTYANNQQTKQFSVKTLQIDPSVAAKVQIPSRDGQVSAEVARLLVAMPDIRVQGLEVHSVNPENTLQPPTVVTKGVTGREYSLHCVMEPVGPVASSSVRFLFRADGQIVRDVYAPVQPGIPVQMGAKWTPSATGTHTLVCEANPEKTFAEATFENNLKQALFQVGPAMFPEAAIETAPGRLPPGPLGRGEEEQPEEKTITIDDGAGSALSDLVPELKLQGGGVLFPLQLMVLNEGTNSTPPSRVRVTWSLTCQEADGTSARTFPVGPRDQVFSVPAIAPQQSYEVPGLTGPKQYCEAPPAAVRANLACAENCYVRALADADHVVNESNEVNNTASVEVKRK